VLTQRKQGVACAYDDPNHPPTQHTHHMPTLLDHKMHLTGMVAASNSAPEKAAAPTNADTETSTASEPSGSNASDAAIAKKRCPVSTRQECIVTSGIPNGYKPFLQSYTYTKCNFLALQQHLVS
jgi:hypothetical protein